MIETKRGVWIPASTAPSHLVGGDHVINLSTFLAADAQYRPSVPEPVDSFLLRHPLR